MKEQQLIELAQSGWNLTMKEFYYPPLNEPNYIFDFTNLEGFYIDPKNNWTITMNLANVPLFLEVNKYVDYFHAITLHEVAHYQIIPYDGLINAKLLRAAMIHVDEYLSPVVVNLFADLVIDKKLCCRKPELIKWEIKTTYEHVLTEHKNQLSSFSKFLFRCYELLLEIELSELDCPEEIDLLSKRIVDIINKNFEDEREWEEKVSKIASVMEDFIKNSFARINSQKSSEQQVGKKRINLDNDFDILLPNDVLELMDNPFEVKNGDKLKPNANDELREKAELFAGGIEYSDFGAPATLAGILVDENPLATWYRAKSKNLIEIKIKKIKPQGTSPIYPDVWRIGDSIEDLDIQQSLLVNPVLIPNFTTRKWKKREGMGLLTEKVLPDLLLVIDSSGSMNWNYERKRRRGKYHTALIAAFAALHFAVSKGAKFSVINFSNIAEICDWTNDYNKAETVLLRYQGGGTVLPIKALFSQCQKSERKVLIFIITDFGIHNWLPSKKSFIDLKEKGHEIIGFFIGSKEIPINKFSDLTERIQLYPIKNQKSLIELVIEELKNSY